MDRAAPAADPGTGFGPVWWAYGLAMHERAAGRRPVPGSAARGDPLGVEHWRAVYGPGGEERFVRRLSDVGLDAHGLAELLAEPAEAIAARCARPAWADMIELACVFASTVDAPTDPAATGVNTLAPAVRPLVAAAGERLAAEVDVGDAVDWPAVHAGFRDQLGGQLCQLAARTLVLELNVARAAGRLTGETSRERFAQFVRQVGTGTGLTSLFTTYPVLARVLGTRCLQSVRAYREILTRFAADRAAIVAELLGGADPGALIAIETGSGDRHRDGRSVCVLRFATGGAVVYKPRSLALHQHFNELIGWLNGPVPWLALRTIGSIARDGYGWQEFITQLPCRDSVEVERFYLRQGALLALLYVLDGADVHHENVIACADQPLVVDIETLFHPTLPPATATGPDPALRSLMSSVHRTALLPTMVVGEHGALDVSGVGGDRNRTYPVDAVDWEAAGTDRMRLVRCPARFSGSANRPRIGAVDAAPEDYTGALVIGFRATYDAIARARDELAGLLDRCAGDDIRIVLRRTQVYGTLLGESTHPDCMRDGLHRDRLFDALWVDSADETLRRVAPHEVRDLWSGDVPMFVGRPGSRHVTAAGQADLPDLLATTGLASVTAKLERMGELDRCDQEWLIEATLASRARPEGHAGQRTLPGSVAPVVPDQERLLCAACAIADEIVARAVHDGERVNWLTTEPVDGRHWTVLPMGAGLGAGYTGVALFLAQLGAVTGMTRYTDLARKAVRPIPRLTEAIGARPELARAVGCGAFLGMGGICYALARLGTLLGDPDLLDWLSSALPLMAMADDGQQAGLAAGRAGGLAAMLAVYAETNLPDAGVLAGRFAERLALPADPETVAVPGDSLPTDGFLWGSTGTGWALLRYAAMGGADRYAELGRAMLALEPGIAIAEPVDYGWCSGLSGRALAAGRDAPVGADQVDLLTDRPALLDMSLCHGELGVLESLLVLAAAGDDRGADAVERGAAVLLGGLNRLGPRCGTPSGVSCPGLLAGLAGIGYGLLRLAMADRVPSVLLLEPSEPKYRKITI
jgi:type 2 lantibiotic biosynthesis protein LanM